MAHRTPHAEKIGERRNASLPLFSLFVPNTLKASEAGKHSFHPQ
jgi:hypothetical protein